jgi:predicted CopG family antitoxin
MPTTTIQIDIEIRDQLRARGRMGESYNDVIRRLLSATRQMEIPRSASGPAPGPGGRSWLPLRDRD